MPIPSLPQEPSAAPEASYAAGNAVTFAKFVSAPTLAGKLLMSCLADDATRMEATDHGLRIERSGCAVLVPWANVVYATVA